MLSRILPLRARMSSRKSMHPLIARMLQTSQFSTQTDGEYF
jgi:hypothetical protein